MLLAGAVKLQRALFAAENRMRSHPRAKSLQPPSVHTVFVAELTGQPAIIDRSAPERPAAAAAPSTPCRQRATACPVQRLVAADINQNI
jgi:hypothetical protein